jgi:hypothetical protein
VTEALVCARQNPPQLPLRPYTNVKISEDALEISILGRPAPEEVLEKLRAPGMHSPRRSETSTWLRR